LWRGEAPAAVAVLLPFGVDRILVACGMGICRDCVGERTSAEIAQMVVEALRVHMPDLRTFTPVAQVGHD
jgi:hypothetical protein